MNTTRLTVADIDTLMKALQVWEEDPDRSGASAALVAMILHAAGQSDPGGDDAMERQIRRRQELSGREVMDRRRVAIRLKAKLLDILEESARADASSDRPPDADNGQHPEPGRSAHAEA